MKKLTLVLLALAMLLVLSGCACKHEETNLVNASKATCTEAGYTGDTVCVKCNETVTKGEVIAAKGHVEGKRTGEVSADCETEGYTGDVYCVNCGELLTKGEVIAKAEHIPGDALMAKEATCEKEGYTGDVRCLACGMTLQAGEVLPALGHTPGEATGVIEPTCTAAGYTGDCVCTVCEKTLKGEVVAKLDHPYENGVCPVCGWRESGLYIGGEKIYTWQELVDNGFVTLQENKNGGWILKAIQKLSGELVIDESVVKLNTECMKRNTLTSIWIPVTCMELGQAAVAESDTLEEVVIFAPIEELTRVFFRYSDALKRVVLPDTLTKIDEMAFIGCYALEEIEIPDGVTIIGNRAFDGCKALKSVKLPAALTTIRSEAFYGCEMLTGIVLPEGVQEIANEAFRGCAALTEINLPEGLVKIGEQAFRETAIEKLVCPSTLVTMHSQSFMESLKYADLSKCAIGELSFGMFGGCKALEEVILPEKLVSFDDYCFNNCPSLKKLVLPEKLMTIDCDKNLTKCTELTSIVWPVTLLDGEALSYLPNLTEIFYRGSEAQWNATSSKELFPNAAVTFNYTDK